MGPELRDVQGAVTRTLSAGAGWLDQDKDHTALLCRETLDEGKSVLLFCGTKKVCRVLRSTCIDVG